jgi:hypothetical protein
MPIIVVGGSGRNVGKTSLVCGLIAALPEYRWAAVKITSHVHGEREAVWEETATGEGTDTARFLAAGARRAFLVTAPEDDLPIAKMWDALGSERNVIFESNRMLNALEPDLCIGVIGGSGSETKPSFEPFLQRADALVIGQDGNAGGLKLPTSARLLRLSDFERVSPEMLDWLRVRLGPPRNAK